MGVIYSNVPPISLKSGDTTIADQIKMYLLQSDQVRIAVGYVSVDGLVELDALIKASSVDQIELVVGMYINSGIPESIKNQIQELQTEWTNRGVGQILMVNNMNYHGKCYLFYRNGEPFAAVVGSANLSVLAPSGTNARQYELAVTVTGPDQLLALHEHIEDVISTSTTSATDLSAFSVIHERIEVLKGYDEVTEVTENEIEQYNTKREDVQFRIPIKVPVADKRFSTERNDYAQSNLNVAYGKGRKGQNGQLTPRNWYEMQITVDAKTCAESDYPKEKPFWVVTDDGYKFEAHTAADHHKQLSAYGSDRVFGHWIKGRLATAGYVKAVDNVFEDTQHEGVITQEMLDKANMRVMVMTKTSRQELGRVYSRKAPTARNKRGALDKKHWEEQLLDVWTLHFEGINE